MGVLSGLNILNLLFKDGSARFTEPLYVGAHALDRLAARLKQDQSQQARRQEYSLCHNPFPQGCTFRSNTYTHQALLSGPTVLAGLIKR